MWDWDGGLGDIAKALKQTHPWEDWWAWYPVTTIGGHRVWGKKISRRVKMKYGDQRLNLEYEYGTVFDILQEAK